MMKRRWFIGLAAGAGAAALAYGAMDAGFVSGAEPANLMLATPSGAALAADRSTLLVDIREPDEWRETGVVEGALLVSYRDAESFLAAVRPHLQPGQSLSLICRSGNRTSKAARQIALQSDLAVIDIGGGMRRVLAEGYRPVAPTAAMGCADCR